MLVDQRYIFSSILAQILFVHSTGNVFLTQHHKTAIVHNIHSDAGSALICSYRALTHICIKACVPGTGTILTSHTSSVAVNLCMDATVSPTGTFPFYLSLYHKSHFDMFSSFVQHHLDLDLACTYVPVIQQQRSRIKSSPVLYTLI